MARFTLSINLGAEGMTTGADVAQALMITAAKMNRDVALGETDRGVIRNPLDGETLGLFGVDAEILPEVDA